MTRPLLIIGNKNYSSWSLRAWLTLRKAGVTFEERRLPLDTPTGHYLQRRRVTGEISVPIFARICPGFL